MRWILSFVIFYVKTVAVLNLTTGVMFVLCLFHSLLFVLHVCLQGPKYFSNKYLSTVKYTAAL